MQSDTAAVRPGEELDLPSLASYLGGPVTVEQFPGGHSNLTYLLHTHRGEMVLRRGPIGAVAPKAHDMAREYRILRAVHPLFPEAPRVFALCEEASVIGSSFFLMERRHGYTLRDHIPAALPLTPPAISVAFVDCLARLHAIPLEEHGLHALGKPEGFVARQIHGWAERWRRAATAEAPRAEELIGWLQRRLPAQGPPTLVHNDYKLDNVLLDGHGVSAVLDWEMATVGEPLADLGMALAYWTWVNRPEVRAAGIPALTLEPEWFSREQLLEHYARRTGREIAGVGYFEVLGVFKLAVIVQQIYLRFHVGQTTDARFRDFGERAAALLDLAARMAETHA
ncbi:MAG TPA: phosphotransferase family protein [Bryobacteraceae bacterium]|nr:phosphotransferase family protein [Bryobacteraceae bacterium]